jgi:hypothetical protein
MCLRVNVYAEELTDQVTDIKEKVGDTTFYGVRIYLKSPGVLEASGDDDLSAVTFWGTADELYMLKRIGSRFAAAASEAELQSLRKSAEP